MFDFSTFVALFLEWRVARYLYALQIKKLQKHLKIQKLLSKLIKELYETSETRFINLLLFDSIFGDKRVICTDFYAHDNGRMNSYLEEIKKERRRRATSKRTLLILGKIDRLVPEILIEFPMNFRRPTTLEISGGHRAK